MRITHIFVKNFRLLKNVDLSIEESSTVIVGRNNSGKTSLTEIFRRLLDDKKPKFKVYDFSISCIAAFKDALSLYLKKVSPDDQRTVIPYIEMGLKISYEENEPDLSTLSDFIIDLDPTCFDVEIIIRFQLKDGALDEFYKDIDDDSDASKLKFVKLLKDRIPEFYETTIFARDPNDNTNVAPISYEKFRQLISAGFINAQRGLDDSTQAEKDILGKVLGKLFKTAGNVSAPEDLKEKSAALTEVVNALQSQVDGDFNEKLNALLPALKIFGYPGLADHPELSTETTLNVENLLESHTSLRYNQGDGIFLPETYNGLGSRNLIFILFQLFEFFRDWQTKPINNNIYLVFIEEPEAHLHPQMQQVFIKQISTIAKEFARTLNDNKPWPVQFIVTTHSSHIANESDFGSIRYFLTKRNEQTETKVKDLRQEFIDPKDSVDKEFLHKYLTLTRSDLFFADKAILIEGTTERILMPLLIAKTDKNLPEEQKLKKQYLSVVEIGGAYAHLFYKFLDFLELRSLIITDLDSVAIPVGKKAKGKYEACTVKNGTHTSNAGIKNWYKLLGASPLTLADLNKKMADEKVSGFRRIAYQVPELKKTYCGRSFEDAFMLANLKLFNITGRVASTKAADAFQKAQGIGKTNFALGYAVTHTDWEVPFYIKEGLSWLAEHPNLKAPVAAKIMEDVIKPADAQDEQ